MTKATPRLFALRRFRIEGRVLWPKRALAIIPLVIAVAAIVACGDDSGVAVAQGRTLLFGAEEPVVVDKVVFVQEDRNLVIRPKATNRQLAVVTLTVQNLTTTIVPMLIDPSAAQLGDRRSDRIDALDPYGAADIGDSADAKKEHGSLVLTDAPLWGDVELTKGFQVTGWMVFDVPKGLILGTLWWSQADTVSIDFIEY